MNDNGNNDYIMSNNKEVKIKKERKPRKVKEFELGDLKDFSDDYRDSLIKKEVNSINNSPK